MSRNRGRPKRHIRDLSREHASQDEVSAVAKAIIEGSSPISTAILGATLVEQELESLLRKQLKRKDEETWKRMTEEGGPISTLSRKIELGYALRLFDDTLRDNLNTVRHIRNAFAHSKKLIDFEHELIAKELRSASLPEAKKSERHKILVRVRKLTGSPQNAYVELCFIVAQELIKRDVRGVKASSRNFERRIKRLSSSFLPSSLFGLPPLKLADIPGVAGRGSGLLFRPNEVSDSTSLALRESQSVGVPPAKDDDDGKDK